METHQCFTLPLVVLFFVSALGIRRNSNPNDVLKCIPTGVHKQNATVRKSEHDKREYKYITMENKLRVLLVSDPGVEMSNAAVSVHAGYTSDPPSAPGLAHFLEHMLFLGTEKYPDEADFMTFISQHGGVTNAMTAEEMTVYFFKIKSDSLRPALGRFSQFFVAPLFDSNSTDRELHAVEQEHQKNYRQDFWRIRYIERSQSRQGHPYGKFGTGNLETLETIPQQNKIDLHEMLLSFYNRYYSANLMTLTVVGKESVEDLERIVVPMFREVKNRDTALTVHTPPYGKRQLTTMLKIPTIMEMNLLELKFQLPDLRCYFRSKPLRYFAKVIGHRGKGSLSSRLKELGWAHELSAREELGLIGFEFFVVRVELTKRGLERVDDIITLFFQYLRMMQNTRPQKWIHEEMMNMDHTKFVFQEKGDSLWYAAGQSMNMLWYEAEHVLDGNFITGQFMEKKVGELFTYFTPGNLRYYIASHTFKGPWNKRARYYDTDYSIHKIPKRKLMKWKGLNQFHLPLKNQFIPNTSDLTIVVPKGKNTVKNIPKIIKDNEIIRVWHMADDTFFLPKVVTIIRIHSPIATNTPSNTNHLAIFADLLRDALEEFGHAANLAGISYYISSADTGIDVHINGFSSNQDVLLRNILGNVVSIKHTMKEENFRNAKQKLLERLTNSKVQVPYIQAINIGRHVLSQTSWSSKERLAYMNKLTTDSLKRYTDSFLQNIYIEAGFFGNILRSAALAKFKIVEEILIKENGASPILPVQHLRPNEYKLTEGLNYLIEKSNTINSPSAVIIHFQVGMQSELNNMKCNLLNQMMSQKLFDTLRTKEQLGYLANSWVSKSHSLVGIQVLVQSDKQPSYVERRIENFLEQFTNDLSVMSQRKFNDYMDATAIKTLEKPKRLSHEAYVYYQEIWRRQYHFRRAQKEVEVLRTLRKKDIEGFFQHHFDPESKKRKKLAVVVLGKNATSLVEEDRERKWTVIGDILAFKSSLPLYGHVMPYNGIPLMSRKKMKDDK